MTGFDSITFLSIATLASGILFIVLYLFIKGR